MSIASSIRKIGFAFLAILGGSMIDSPAQGGIVTLEWYDSGWYRNNGLHDDTNKNYSAGYFSLDVATNRNYFVFDLSGVSEQIVAAEIRLQLGDYVGNPSTYTLRSVETPVATLMASHVAGPAGIAIYDDLADGTVFSSTPVTVGNFNSTLSIPLNAAALTSLNGAIGQKFAFGGELAYAGPQSNFIFGFTGAPNNIRQLVLTTVPEPATWIQLGSGIAAISVFVRSRRTRRSL